MGSTGESGPAAGLPGLRLVEDILSHPPEQFDELWRTADIGTLNRELSLQVYLMAQTTAEKFAALRRVYTGVLVLLVLTAIFIVVLGLHTMSPTFLSLR